LLIELGQAERKGGNGMASQVLVASKSADRFSLNPSIEKMARLGRRFAFASAAFLLFLFLVGFGLMPPDFNRQEVPDWKPTLALADAAQEKGDLYYAKSLYLQGARLAVWRDDWAGLLTAACGIKKLERERGPYSSTNMLLLSAMVAAEKHQSRLGLIAVANAFRVLGEDKAAAMVMSRIEKNWVKDTNDSADIVSPGCWGQVNEKQLPGDKNVILGVP
jgi:hypothetical protein